VRFLAFSALTFVLLAGCANRPPPPDPSPYDEAAYQPFATAGTATLTGSSYLVTKGGDVKRGAARQVFLIPDTPFLRARMKEDDRYYSTFEWLGFGRTDPATITQAWKHTRIVIGDADGKFVFTKVPPGGYFVETKLQWQYVNCGFLGCRMSNTGHVLRERVDIKDGATIEVQLTTAVPQ
jgi:hypothetical protein